MDENIVNKIILMRLSLTENNVGVFFNTIGTKNIMLANIYMYNSSHVV